MAKACPRDIIEIRLRGPKNRRVVVLCNSKDKGPVANKVCKVSCIACGKCVKVCEKAQAITITDNLAYIDASKCILCCKCEEACPKQAIHAIHFPPRRPKAEAPATSKPAPEAVKPVAETAAPASTPSEA